VALMPATSVTRWESSADLAAQDVHLRTMDTKDGAVHKTRPRSPLLVSSSLTPRSISRRFASQQRWVKPGIPPRLIYPPRQAQWAQGMGSKALARLPVPGGVVVFAGDDLAVPSPTCHPMIVIAAIFS